MGSYLLLKSLAGLEKIWKDKRRRKSSTTRCVRLRSRNSFSISVPVSLEISSPKLPRCSLIYLDKPQLRAKPDTPLDHSLSRETRRLQSMSPFVESRLKLSSKTPSKLRSMSSERVTSRAMVSICPFHTFIDHSVSKPCFIASYFTFFVSLFF